MMAGGTVALYAGIALRRRQNRHSSLPPSATVIEVDLDDQIVAPGAFLGLVVWVQTGTRVLR